VRVDVVFVEPDAIASKSFVIFQCFETFALYFPVEFLRFVEPEFEVKGVFFGIETDEIVGSVVLCEANVELVILQFECRVEFP
jgi:hypothetical protein